LRVRAVSYLNTSPLVWGMLHGPQRGVHDLRFSLPSECADALREGAAEVGLVPVIELARQRDLVAVPGCAIACRGPVRSILLVSKKPMDEIESIAADAGSRSSVAMTQVLLERKHGVFPRILTREPDLDSMLEQADAALIIGDPALRIDPEMESWRGKPVHVFDMGGEWVETTGLPMVFAVWAAKAAVADPQIANVLQGSAAYGREQLEEIIAEESAARDLSPELVRDYLTNRIVFELGEREQRGMRTYLEAARDLGLAGEHAADIRGLSLADCPQSTP